MAGSRWDGERNPTAARGRRGGLQGAGWGEGTSRGAAATRMDGAGGDQRQREKMFYLRGEVELGFPAGCFLEELEKAQLISQ